MAYEKIPALLDMYGSPVDIQKNIKPITTDYVYQIAHNYGIDSDEYKRLYTDFLLQECIGIIKIIIDARAKAMLPSYFQLIVTEIDEGPSRQVCYPDWYLTLPDSHVFTHNPKSPGTHHRPPFYEIQRIDCRLEYPKDTVDNPSTYSIFIDTSCKLIYSDPAFLLLDKSTRNKAVPKPQRIFDIRRSIFPDTAHNKDDYSCSSHMGCS